MEGLVQIKLFSKSFQNFRREFWIQRIDLTRFTRCEMNDQEGYNGDEKQGDDLLYSAAAYK